MGLTRSLRQVAISLKLSKLKLCKKFPQLQRNDSEVTKLCETLSFCVVSMTDSDTTDVALWVSLWKSFQLNLNFNKKT